jgi:protein-tyrosine phosphatase
MAEAVFRHLVNEAGLGDRFEIASAATTDEELGERPHRGTLAILQARGIPIDPGKRAQQVTTHLLEEYEYIIGMTGGHTRELGWFGAEAHRLMEYAPGGPGGAAQDVPDPWYSGNFEQVYTMIQTGCRGLLAYIRQNEGL